MLSCFSCVRLCNPMDCSPPGSSVHWLLQARILEWGCHSLLQGIFQTQGSNPRLLCLSPALAGRFFTISATWGDPQALLMTRREKALCTRGLRGQNRAQQRASLQTLKARGVFCDPEEGRAWLSKVSSLFRGNWISIRVSALYIRPDHGGSVRLAWGLQCTEALPHSQFLNYRTYRGACLLPEGHIGTSTPNLSIRGTLSSAG